MYVTYITLDEVVDAVDTLQLSTPSKAGRITNCLKDAYYTFVEQVDIASDFLIWILHSL